MILLAYSTRDVAGINIAKQVFADFSFSATGEFFQDNPVFESEIKGKPVSLITLSNETIYAQDLPEQFSDVELLIFLSRHSSQSGKPTLSVHTTGNFGNADLGGFPRTLSVCPAAAMQTALKTLAKLKTELELPYEVSYECTHHGPTLNVPTIFVELGSTPLQWTDTKAAKAVAHAAIEAIVDFQQNKKTAVIGIGGPHYNQLFTRMTLNDEAVFGHMIPKYALPLVDAKIMRQCVEQTVEKVSHAILDWKGIPSQNKPPVLNALEQIKLPYSKI